MSSLRSAFQWRPGRLWRSSTIKPILVDDVLLRILCLCDISTVISMSQACKRLHSLAFSRQVWLALLSTLHIRNFIDLLPGQNLQELSLDALIELAKRTVHGPHSWKALDLTHLATHSRTLNTNLGIQPAAHSPRKRNKVKLLPGGRFVLFMNLDKLRCWNVASDTQVWQYQGDNLNFSESKVLDFSVEVIDEGRAASILIVVSEAATAIWHYPARIQLIIDVVHLDLLQGSFRLVVRHYLPVERARSDTPLIFSANICGDFAILKVNILGGGDEEILYLLRLCKPQTYRSFLMSKYKYQIDLVPGYLIMVEYKQYQPRGFLRIWSAEALMGLAVSLNDAPPCLSQTISSGGLTTTSIRLSAHASPLQEEIYVIWLTVVTSDANVSVYRYKLSQSPTPRLALYRKVSPLYSMRGYAFPFDSRILYAGHARVHADDSDVHDRHLLPLSELISDDIPPKVELSPWPASKNKLKVSPPAILLPRGEGMDISAYSGTLTFCREHQIVINYYE